jgi:hypothetical protein
MVSGYDKRPPEPRYRPTVSPAARTAFLVGLALGLALILAWTLMA